MNIDIKITLKIEEIAQRNVQNRDKRINKYKLKGD